MVGYTVIRSTRDRDRFQFEIRMLKRPAFAERSLVRQYLLGQSLRDQEKIVSRIMTMAEMGPKPRPERYGDLGEGIYEMKIDQHRIPFFYAGQGIIVLTHGFFKTTQKAPPREVRRARELRSLYDQQFGG
jgi:phage-related protein